MVLIPAWVKKIYMKLVNNSEQFTLFFNGKDYVIPKGEFEIVDEKIVNHLLARAKFWDKKVEVIKTEQPEAIKKIDEIKVAEKEPVFSGATTETLPKRSKKNA